MAPRRSSVAIDGPLVRRIRSRLKLSQADLATKANISRQHLLLIEKPADAPNARDRVSPLVLNALAAALGVEPEVLIVPDARPPAGEVA